MKNKILAIIVPFVLMFCSKNAYGMMPEYYVPTAAYRFYIDSNLSVVLALFYCVLISVVVCAVVFISFLEKSSFKKAVGLGLVLCAIQAIYFQFYKEGYISVMIPRSDLGILIEPLILKWLLMGVVLVPAVIWVSVVYFVARKFLFPKIRIVSALIIAAFLTAIPGVNILGAVVRVFEIMYPFVGTKFNGVI